MKINNFKLYGVDVAAIQFNQIYNLNYNVKNATTLTIGIYFPNLIGLTYHLTLILAKKLQANVKFINYHKNKNVS
jgi:hypothetical protein